mmetsp:Transcript_110225/g.235373  ORF Transcript_110225/g.235373 Transcript_110225/m.235373 type:complete len:581 (-) Transcript_110225:243-1985(-)
MGTQQTAEVSDTGMPVACAEGVAAGLRVPVSNRQEKLKSSGGETPETGTPATRSLSPSSDGGASLPPSERGGYSTTSKATSKAPGDVITAGTGGTGAEGEEEVKSASLRLGAEADASEAAEEVLESSPGGGAIQTAAVDTTAEAGAAAPAAGKGQPLPGQEVAPAPAVSSGGGRGGAGNKGGSRGSRAKAAGRDRDAGRSGAGSQGASAETSTMPPAPMGAFSEPTQGVDGMDSFSDRRIIQALAAPEEMHRRLLRTARWVPGVIAEASDQVFSSSIELYGSLSMDMTAPPESRSWNQDWASYYVNGRSDVDFVVEMRHRQSPSSIAQRLIKKGNWRMVGQVQVHKFASTQFTLLGSCDEVDAGKETSGEENKVYLDITCIEDPLHFKRFKLRQEAFRDVFQQVRASLEANFAAQGALAFDAYVHLLKAFAAKVPGNTLTGFQATCVGLFTLQICHYRLKPGQSIALALFEGFLRFCWSFYADIPPQPRGRSWTAPNYRRCAITLSDGGSFLPRMSTTWRSELYFLAVEESMHTRPDERMNVTHSLDPLVVSWEAQALLNRAFHGAPGGNLFAPDLDVKV